MKRHLISDYALALALISTVAILAFTTAGIVGLLWLINGVLYGYLAITSVQIQRAGRLPSSE